MILLYIILFVAFIIDTRLVFLRKDFNKDYLSPCTCSQIKGLLVMLVFLAHGNSYVLKSDNMLDTLFSITHTLLGQLIVVMFLFYSGYGIFEKLKTNDTVYSKNFLRKRFLPTYLNFVICVFIYLILSYLIRADYSNKRILMAFLGWESIGNSNWFMFDIFALYLIFFVSFRFLKNKSFGLILFTVFSITLTLFLYVEKSDYCWWNTLLCFPLGMWWSYYRNNIEETLFSSTKKWLICFIFSFMLFAFFYICLRRVPIAYLGTSIFFALSFCIVTMKFRFNNTLKIFSFLGAHVFSMYMLQRLVFILFSCVKLNQIWWIFYPVCLFITIVIAVLFDKFTKMLRTKISFFN